MLQIALVLPVTSATCDEARFKTQARFTNLSSINIESDLLDSKTVDSVLDEFATKNTRLKLI